MFALKLEGRFIARAWITTRMFVVAYPRLIVTVRWLDWEMYARRTTEASDTYVSLAFGPLLVLAR